MPPAVGYYDGSATARYVDEPAKRAGRTAFGRDRARVVHSSALRRLAAKTQVVGPTSDDFVRNRLTHSLEVAQIGRELGAALGCDPDLVETACLAHDIGHPPFGHNGERALDEVAAAVGGFEGNAQTVRLLTRLEAKTRTPDGRSAGLNLTRATLDAVCKYPWLRKPGLAKFNVYAEDAEVFDWLRAEAPGERLCLEAQVMDWADDVAYSVHDVEDGVVSGHVPLAALQDSDHRGVLCDVARTTYAPDADVAELDEALGRLFALDCWPEMYDGSRRAAGTLKNLTSQLIGRFCAAVERATQEAAGPAPLVRYDADLVIPREVRLEVAVLKAVAAHWVMYTGARVELLAEQRRLVTDLVAALLATDGARLAPAYREDWAAAPHDDARLRVVIDQVASLTDPSAIVLAQEVGVG